MKFDNLKRLAAIFLNMVLSMLKVKTCNGCFHVQQFPHATAKLLVNIMKRFSKKFSNNTSYYFLALITEEL